MGTYPSNGILSKQAPRQDFVPGDQNWKPSAGLDYVQLYHPEKERTVGRVGLLCASTPQPLLQRASVIGAGVGRLCLSCPKEALGEWASPLETNGFRGAHAFFASTWPLEVSVPVKLSLGLMKFLSE